MELQLKQNSRIQHKCRSSTSHKYVVVRLQPLKEENIPILFDLLEEAPEWRPNDAKLSTQESTSTVEVAAIKDSWSGSPFPPIRPVLHGLPTVSDLPPDMLIENVESSLAFVSACGSVGFCSEFRGSISAPRAKEDNIIKNQTASFWSAQLLNRYLPCRVLGIISVLVHPTLLYKNMWIRGPTIMLARRTN